MGVYLTNMDMPKEGSWATVRIYPDGTCAVPNWQGDCTLIRGVQAVPVPPHGRLGDLDRIERTLHEWESVVWDRNALQMLRDCINLVKAAPTIVPADPEEKGETT